MSTFPKGKAKVTTNARKTNAIKSANCNLTNAFPLGKVAINRRAIDGWGNFVIYYDGRFVNRPYGTFWGKSIPNFKFKQKTIPNFEFRIPNLKTISNFEFRISNLSHSSFCVLHSALYSPFSFLTHKSTLTKSPRGLTSRRFCAIIWL